jgi:hypothetical protein
MSVFYYEPFVSSWDFDRMFDEALSTRVPSSLIKQRPTKSDTKAVEPR